MRRACGLLIALTLLGLLAAAGCGKPRDATPEEANLELELPFSDDPPDYAPDRVSHLTIDGRDYSRPRGTARLLKVRPGEGGAVKVVYTFCPNTYTKIIRTKVVQLEEGKRVKTSLLKEDPATPDVLRPIYVPTPHAVVRKMCQMAKIGKD